MSVFIRITSSLLFSDLISTKLTIFIPIPSKPAIEQLSSYLQIIEENMAVLSYKDMIVKKNILKCLWTKFKSVFPSETNFIQKKLI